MDEIRIKATSIVILYDDRTSRIVSFDVEPGFEHQWGYGRQRFMAKKTLSGESYEMMPFHGINITPVFNKLHLWFSMTSVID